ncbi:MAG: glycosyltransferase family 4 protein [Crocinitomicaceae bacterium]
MKLLILYTKDRNEVFNRKSAIGSYIHCLSNILQSEGYTVFLNGDSLDSINKIETERLPTNAKKVIARFLPSFLKRALRDRMVLKNANNIATELLDSEARYDAILEFYNLGSDVGVRLAKSQNIPLYIVYDGPIIEEYMFFNNGAKPIFLKEFTSREKTALMESRKTVVYSNPMKSYVENITGNASNLSLHQNVDFSRFDILEGEKNSPSSIINICFIGSFLKWHQVDILVNTCCSLIKEGYSIELYLVGDGMEKASIEAEVNLLDESTKSKIHFTGFLDGTALYDLKKKMHVGIMPGSNWYGAPNKIFEYGAMNMAVIAPDTPTICDLFSNNEIVFFKWKNSESFKMALKELISKPELIEKMALKLQHFVLDTYSAKETKKYYTNLLK